MDTELRLLAPSYTFARGYSIAGSLHPRRGFPTIHPTSRKSSRKFRASFLESVSVTLSMFLNANASCIYNMPLSPGRRSSHDSSRSLRIDMRWPLLVRSALTRKPTFRQEGGSPIRNPNFCTSHGFRTPIACRG
ncbi:hypothetical protein BDQ94DRAFT_29846 [Aspergillus welwitschiae]|uniref:Uncharacterized protein n=1 Tax=Aspergillus welwitschiae TaxID=1341132 RepID=A0A3F3Q2Z0_9EURO|nr:hypothetical protein BDQ94DRAFT_29846 [Aspergillus welwitschiae]RDH33465.1 hypothetical protein BDQ94DRAFT_29846 [Aspergillus welwitschiae]